MAYINFFGSMKEWWLKLSYTVAGKKMQARQELTAYILWHIWKTRNTWTFKAEKLSEMEVVQRAVGKWLEFKEEREIRREGHARSGRRERQQVPETGRSNLMLVQFLIV